MTQKSVFLGAPVASRDGLIRRAVLLKEQAARLRKAGKGGAADRLLAEFEEIRSRLGSDTGREDPARAWVRAQGLDGSRESMGIRMPLDDLPRDEPLTSGRIAADEVKHNKPQMRRFLTSQGVQSSAEKGVRREAKALETRIKDGQVADAGAARLLLQEYYRELRRFKADPYYRATPREVQRFKSLADVALNPEGVMRKSIETGIDLADFYSEYQMLKESGYLKRNSAWVGKADRTAVPFSDASVEIANAWGLPVADIYRMLDKAYGRDAKKVFTDSAKIVTKSMASQRGLTEKDLVLKEEGGLNEGQSGFVTAMQDRAIRANPDLAMIGTGEAMWRHARDAFNNPATILLQGIEGEMNDGRYRADDKLIDGEKAFRFFLDSSIQELASRGMGKWLRNGAEAVKFLRPLLQVGEGVTQGLDKLKWGGSLLRVGGKSVLGALPDAWNQSRIDSHISGKGSILGSLRDQMAGISDLSYLLDPNLSAEDKVIRAAQQTMLAHSVKGDARASKSREANRRALDERGLKTVFRDGKPALLADLSDQELSHFREQTRAHSNAPIKARKRLELGRDLGKIEREISRRANRTEVDRRLEALRAEGRRAGLPDEKLDALLPVVARQLELGDELGLRLPGIEAADTATPNALRQTEGVLDGTVETPKFRNKRQVAKWLEGFAKENPVFREDLRSLSDEEIVAGLKEHTLRELKALETVQRQFPDFFRRDITEVTNPELQAYAREKYGKDLEPEHVQLFHILSALASPARSPRVDTSVGFQLFDRFMRTGDLSASASGSTTIRADALGRVRGLIEKKGLKGAVDWLTTHQSPESIRAEFGDDVFAKRDHEYIDGQKGGYGLFAVTGPKLPAYAMNRLQKLGFVTKDRWYARILGRMAGEPLVAGGKVLSKTWDTSPEGVRKRKLADRAWAEAASELGVEPADIAQRMWEAEHFLYEKMGAKSRVHSISEGLREGIERVRSRGSLPPSGESPLLLQAEGGRVKGTFDPHSWIVQLMKGKADVSTAIHEVSGHWFENVLRGDREFGPVLERVYGGFGSERFARHVEQYLLTGKAPVKGLQDVFQAIGTWMKQIYSRQRLSAMPREVRAVFDRIHGVETERVRRLVQDYRARHPRRILAPPVLVPRGSEEERAERFSLFPLPPSPLGREGGFRNA